MNKSSELCAVVFNLFFKKITNKKGVSDLTLDQQSLKKKPLPLDFFYPDVIYILLLKELQK